MLAFLLAHGEEPLVLDQPEDDLDNHLIYDLVVRQIRENKFRRQIIVVTHNPNIVVNGDAEMLHALEFDGGQCVVRRSGSLQDEVIREEVCRVMEGGREGGRHLDAVIGDSDKGRHKFDGSWTPSRFPLRPSSQFSADTDLTRTARFVHDLV